MTSSDHTTNTKRCSKCGLLKPATFEYFSRQSGAKDGFCPWCRSCKNEYAKARARKNGVKPPKRTVVDGMRQCHQCKEWKPLTEEHFHRNRSNYTGFHPTCKQCALLNVKQYQKDHAEAIKARKKEYRQLHRDEISKRDKAYYQQHKAEARRYEKIYKEKNLDRLKANRKAYYWRDPETARAKSRDYAQKNPGYDRVSKERRRARKLSLPDTLSTKQWKAALEYFDSRCAYCNTPPGLFKSLRFSQDHFIPLSDTNCPGTVATNILPCCHSCNSSKNDSDPRTWLVSRFGARKAKQILKRITAYFDWVKEQDG